MTYMTCTCSAHRTASVTVLVCLTASEWRPHSIRLLYYMHMYYCHETDCSLAKQARPEHPRRPATVVRASVDELTLGVR
jgi:hypothetical protein